MFLWGLNSLMERPLLICLFLTLAALLPDTKFPESGAFGRFKARASTKSIIGSHGDFVAGGDRDSDAFLQRVSLVEINASRVDALGAYREGVIERIREILGMKRSLLRLILHRAKAKRESRHGCDRCSLSTHKRPRANVDVGVADIVVALIREQVRLAELLLDMATVFWYPTFNYGVDASSQPTAGHSSLDILGEGGSDLRDAGNYYGGRSSSAADTDSGSSDSLLRTLGSMETCRYLMVYNYLLILGLIYRRGKHFERNVKYKLLLFYSAREGLISSRDSLSLLLGSDLPDDINLPPPIPSPSYLDIGANCNLGTYYEIKEVISFFRRVQDENRVLANEIRNARCDSYCYDFRGCSSCETRKASVSIIEWTVNDIQFDIERFERGLKLCVDSMRRVTDQDARGVGGTGERACGDLAGEALEKEGIDDGHGDRADSTPLRDAPTEETVSAAPSSSRGREARIRVRNRRYTRRSILSKKSVNKNSRRSQTSAAVSLEGGTDKWDCNAGRNDTGTAVEHLRLHKNATQGCSSDSNGQVRGTLETGIFHFDSEFNVSVGSEHGTEDAAFRSRNGTDSSEGDVGDGDHSDADGSDRDMSPSVWGKREVEAKQGKSSKVSKAEKICCNRRRSGPSYSARDL